jgi:putative membrane protein
MARTTLLAAAAVAAMSLSACQRQDSAPNPTQPGTENQAVNGGQDATSAAVGGVAAATAGPVNTDAFVSNAAISDMYEIQAGQIAQQKGNTQAVKDFGKMMVADHTALSESMKPLIQAAGKTPPPGLDERRKGLIDNLNAAPSSDFDKVYLDQQEAAHNEALTLMTGYGQRGGDAGLRGAAQQAAPKIQAHLDHVKRLKSGEDVAH